MSKLEISSISFLNDTFFLLDFFCFPSPLVSRCVPTPVASLDANIGALSVLSESQNPSSSSTEIFRSTTPVLLLFCFPLPVMHNIYTIYLKHYYRIQVFTI